MTQLDLGQLWRGTHGPAWRQYWARSLPLDRWPGEGVDPSVRRLHQYLQARAQDPHSASRAHPLLAAAEQVDSRPKLVSTLQLLALAGATPIETAQRSGLDVEVISLWSHQSFDIGEFRGACAWLYTFVLEPVRAADPRLAAQMRAVLSGGLPALDALLAAETESPSDPRARQQRHNVRLALRSEQALDQLPDTPAVNLALVKLAPTVWKAQALFPAQRAAPSAAPPQPLPTAPLLELNWAVSAEPSSARDSTISTLVAPFGDQDAAVAADSFAPAGLAQSA